MSESEVQELQFAAWAGIDWADQKHAWCLQATDTTQRENGEVQHTVEAIEACSRLYPSVRQNDWSINVIDLFANYAVDCYSRRDYGLAHRLGHPHDKPYAY